MQASRRVLAPVLLVIALAVQAQPYRLSIYYQGPAGLAGEIERAFERFRGDVMTFVPLTPDVASDPENVAASADLVWGGGESLHRELRAADRLVSFRSSELNAIDSRYWKTEPANPVSGLECLVIACAQTLPPATPAPTRWRDLLKPQWDGRIALRDPSAGSEGFSAAAAMARALGWSFLESLAAKRPVVAASDEQALASVAAGDALAAIVAYQAVTETRTSFEVVWPADGPLVTPRPIAILKQAKRPALMNGLAQQLVDYVLSAEGQAAGRRFGVFPTRLGASPPQGAPPLAESAVAAASEAPPAEGLEQLRRLFGVD